METNRMMSPCRQAACGSCAGRAALSLAVLAQGRLADRRAVRRSIGLRKRTARRAGDGGAGGAIAFYAEMPAAEISAAGIFDSFPFFALGSPPFFHHEVGERHALPFHLLLPDDPIPSFFQKRLRRNRCVGADNARRTPGSSLSQRAVATPLP